MPTRRMSRKDASRKPASPALKYLYDRYIGEDPHQRAAYEEHLNNAEIARQIHDLRTKACLSQRALAQRIGTTASVICRLEDADYNGHSLSILRRIGTALNQRLEVRFVPAKKELIPI